MRKVFLITILIVSFISYFNLYNINNIKNIDNGNRITYVDNKVIIEDDFEEIKEVFTNPNEVLIGRMSGYGPDCVGCTGYLAYDSIYVGNGNIYYEDREYGKIRIVAGDRKYPFGTIVRINDSMNVIVLDRGGAIGIGKSFLFDLLFPSEYEANMNGILIDTKFEILRYGF